MRSSTSNSENLPQVAAAGESRPIAAHRFAALLACIVIFLCALELGTRFGFHYVSKMESRHAAEFAAASSIGGRPGQTSVLLVGNSLLLEGVDFPKLRSSMPADARIWRFALEDTGILEWRFGLRRLIAEGTRPTHVVLALGASNFRSHTLRSDYSAFYLLRARDIPQLASSLHYDLTHEADLYFARFSLFYAGRNLIRNFAVNLATPSYADLLHGLAVAERQQKRPDDSRAAMLSDIVDMRQSCEAIDARFIVLIMPGFEDRDALDVTAAAHDSGVAVVEPVAERGFSQNLYRDGYHLNAEGSERFTALLAPQLIAQLGADGSQRRD